MAVNSDEEWKNATSIYDFKAINIDGEEVSLEKYRGHVCIIVNVASKCGKTHVSYTQLQEQYEKYGESKGLKILGFPCNQFAYQEPGTDAEIKEFVKTKYNITFDMFSKIDVNGANAHPLFNYLKNKQPGLIGNFLKWNYTKFLINKEGQPVKRYGPTTDPVDMEKDYEEYW